MTTLQVGEQAPSFEGLNQDNKKIRLADYKGKKVVLYFYPKDNTPGCTAQACSLRDAEGLLQKKGFVILGISTDNVKSHQKFQKDHNLPFDLIADTDKRIVNEYGVYGEKQMMGKKYMGIHRTTFVLDEKGIIRHIIHKPNTQNHASEILALEG